MRLASVRTRFEDTVIGGVLTVGGDQLLVDVARVAALRLAEQGEPRPGALAEMLIPCDMRVLLEGGDRSQDEAKAALAYASAALADADRRDHWRRVGLVHGLDEVEFLPPITRPGKIISVGANYRTHLAEFDEDSAGGVIRELGRATYPPAFSKLPSTLVGHEGAVLYPAGTTQLDYEAELCLVIGTRCKNVPAEKYLDVVAGFTIMNDVSMRDIQVDEMSRGLLLMGKNLDTTAPCGPYLVTRDEIPDPQALQISCWVNGERRQHETTAAMIFDLGAIIAHYSKMTLEPGDIITTGSPAGVGATRTPPEQYLLKPGDVVEIEIEGLGRLRNHIVSEA